MNQELSKTKPEIIKEVTYKTPLKSELLSMKVEMARLSSKYGKAHPKILNLEEKILAIRNLIKNDAQSESSTTQLVSNPKYGNLIEKKEDLTMNKKLLLSKRKDIMALQKVAINNLSMAPELEQYLNQLTRNKASIEKMYFTLQEKLQDTQLRK